MSSFWLKKKLRSLTNLKLKLIRMTITEKNKSDNDLLPTVSRQGSNSGSGSGGLLATASWMDPRALKYISLVVLTIQNSISALSLRYSRSRLGDKYITSTAVLNTEIVKLFLSLFLVYKDEKGVDTLIQTLKNAFGNPIDLLKISVPSLVYIIQNNLLYVAVSHLDAVTFQISLKLRMLATAIFSVILLKRKIYLQQWLAFVCLIIGISIVQMSQTEKIRPPTLITSNQSKGASSKPENNKMIGFLAALSAATCSGFASVYFEHLLKNTNTSLWVRNVQMSSLSIILGIIACIGSDWKSISTKGFLFGYDLFVVWIIILQATGGLIVAVVVKYADNLLKCVVASLAIVISCAISILFLNFELTVQFTLGSITALGGIFLYSFVPNHCKK